MPEDVTRHGEKTEGGSVRSPWASRVVERLRKFMVHLLEPPGPEEPSPTVESTPGLTVAELIVGGHVPEAVVEHLRSEGERARVAQEAMLRAIADGEEVRRRLAQQHEQAVKFANEGLLRAMLPVLDNLELCLEHSTDDTAPLREAMEMTLRQWHDVFEQAGAVRIGAERGGEFDPRIHEAVMQEPDAEIPNGSIARSVQPGFLFHQRVLRPARVSLSTGVPDIEAKEEPREPAYRAESVHRTSRTEGAEQDLEPESSHGVEVRDAEGRAQRGRSDAGEARSTEQTTAKERPVRAASRAKSKSGAKRGRTARSRRRGKRPGGTRK